MNLSTEAPSFVSLTFGGCLVGWWKLFLNVDFKTDAAERLKTYSKPVSLTLIPVFTAVFTAAHSASVNSLVGRQKQANLRAFSAFC